MLNLSTQDVTSLPGVEPKKIGKKTSLSNIPDTKDGKSFASMLKDAASKTESKDSKIAQAKELEASKDFKNIKSSATSKPTSNIDLKSLLNKSVKSPKDPISGQEDSLLKEALQSKSKMAKSSAPEILNATKSLDIKDKLKDNVKDGIKDNGKDGIKDNVKELAQNPIFKDSKDIQPNLQAATQNPTKTNDVKQVNMDFKRSSLMPFAQSSKSTQDPKHKDIKTLKDVENLAKEKNLNLTNLKMETIDDKKIAMKDMTPQKPFIAPLLKKEEGKNAKNITTQISRDNKEKIEDRPIAKSALHKIKYAYEDNTNRIEVIERGVKKPANITSKITRETTPTQEKLYKDMLEARKTEASQDIEIPLSSTKDAETKSKDNKKDNLAPNNQANKESTSLLATLLKNPKSKEDAPKINPATSNQAQNTAIAKHIEEMGIKKPEIKNDMYTKLESKLKNNAATPAPLAAKEVDDKVHNELYSKLATKEEKAKKTKSSKIDDIEPDTKPSYTQSKSSTKYDDIALNKTQQNLNDKDAREDGAQKEVLKEVGKESIKGEILKEKVKEKIEEQKSEVATSEKKDEIKEVAKEKNQNVISETRKQEFAFTSARARESIRNFNARLQEEVRNYRGPLTKISMELHPENLGTLELTLSKKGNDLVVNVVSNSSAIALFMANQQDLKSNLINAGFNNVDLNFSDSGQNQSGSQNNQGDQGSRRDRGDSPYANLDEQTQLWNKNSYDTMKIVFPIVA